MKMCDSSWKKNRLFVPAGPVCQPLVTLLHNDLAPKTEHTRKNWRNRCDGQKLCNSQFPIEFRSLQIWHWHSVSFHATVPPCRCARCLLRFLDFPLVLHQLQFHVLTHLVICCRHVSSTVEIRDVAHVAQVANLDHL